jgi:hypothetical protein
MRAYNNISIMENRRRVKALEEFDKLLGDYISRDLDDGVNAKLCNKWPKIYEFLLPKNKPDSPSKQLPLLYKFGFFDYQQIGIALRCDIDAYKKNALRAWFNTFNPFWWALQTIGFLLRLVVKLLDFIGFGRIQTKEFSKWIESDCATVVIFLSTIASGIAALIYIILCLIA